MLESIRPQTKQVPLIAHETPERLWNALTPSATASACGHDDVKPQTAEFERLDTPSHGESPKRLTRCRTRLVSSYPEKMSDYPPSSGWRPPPRAVLAVLACTIAIGGEAVRHVFTLSQEAADHCPSFVNS